MDTHRKIFPVAKMPWHTDDHRFGERGEDAGVQDTDVINVFQPLAPPPIDSTIAMIDDGRCYVCGKYATYLYKGKLYCVGCWLAWDWDNR